MRRGCLALAVCGAMAVGTGGAIAETMDAYSAWAPSGSAMIRSGSWYAGFGARAEYQFLKTYVGPVHGNATVGGGPQTVIGARALAVGPDGTLGYVLPDGTLPAWLGRNFRVEAEGGWQGGRVTRTVQSAFVGGLGRFFPVTGIAIPFGFVNGGNTQSSLLVRTSQWQVGLTGKSDYNLTPTFLVSPFVQVFGGSARANYDLYDRFNIAGFGFSDNVRAERLQTWQIGGKLGANLVWEITHFARVNFGGHVGLSYQRANYSGLECISVLNGIPNCPAGTGTLSAFIFRASGSGSQIGFLGGAEIGASYSFDWLIVSLAGGWRYNSATPGIRNPSPTSPGPAGVAFTGEHTLSAQIKLTVPFR